jgi:hypothetical protein
VIGTYEIHKNVPVREGRGGGRGLSGSIRRMNPGDSIVVPVNLSPSIHACARSVGAKVRTRRSDDGTTVTIWRLDQAASSSAGSPLRSPDPQPATEPGPVAGPAQVFSIAVAGPTPLRGGPVAPTYTSFRSAFETTVADPEEGLPAGYFYLESPYSSRFWREGPPPDAPDYVDPSLTPTTTTGRPRVPRPTPIPTTPEPKGGAFS